MWFSSKLKSNNSTVQLNTIHVLKFSCLDTRTYIMFHVRCAVISYGMRNIISPARTWHIFLEKSWYIVHAIIHCESESLRRTYRERTLWKCTRICSVKATGIGILFPSDYMLEIVPHSSECDRNSIAKQHHRYRLLPARGQFGAIQFVYRVSTHIATNDQSRRLPSV